MNHPEPSTPSPWFFVVWICMMLFGTYGLSRQSGWHTLWQSFPGTDDPPGIAFRWNAISLNQCGYRGFIFAVVSEQGIFIQPLLPIPFHPALLIPWSAFSPFKKKRWDKIFETTITIPDGKTIRFVATLPLQQEIEKMLEREAQTSPQNTSTPLNS